MGVVARFLSAVDMPDVLPGEGGNDYLYYGLCALFFTLCGLAAGFFIWRKGHMQTLDAEQEVKRTGEELALMRDDLSAEEKEIRPSEESKERDERLEEQN